MVASRRCAASLTSTLVPLHAATPTTKAPITEAPITEAPITEAPITEAPITEAGAETSTAVMKLDPVRAVRTCVVAGREQTRREPRSAPPCRPTQLLGRGIGKAQVAGGGGQIPVPVGRPAAAWHAMPIEPGQSAAPSPVSQKRRQTLRAMPPPLGVTVKQPVPGTQSFVNMQVAPSAAIAMVGRTHWVAPPVPG
jgi:hypothetical protein